MAICEDCGKEFVLQNKRLERFNMCLACAFNDSKKFVKKFEKQRNKDWEIWRGELEG